MQQLEQYEDLIERDPEAISCIWKCFPIVFFIITSGTSYISSILFYIYWYEIFGGKCPFWGKVETVYWHKHNKNDHSSDKKFEWSKELFGVYPFESQCTYYFGTSLFSCFLGITCCVIVGMCGRGGFDNRMSGKPWRIVVPIMLLCLSLSVMTIVATLLMTQGTEHFTDDLFESANEALSSKNLSSLNSHCDALETFNKLYNYHNYDACEVIMSLYVFSWIMTSCWLIVLMLFCCRLYRVNDFRILKISLYEVPIKDKDNFLKRTFEDSLSSWSVEPPRKKRKTFKQILCCYSETKEE